jgi:hypothetical protein
MFEPRLTLADAVFSPSCFGPVITLPSSRPQGSSVSLSDFRELDRSCVGVAGVAERDEREFAPRRRERKFRPDSQYFHS